MEQADQEEQMEQYIYIYAKEEEHTELSGVHNIIGNQKSYKYAYNANRGGDLVIYANTPSATKTMHVCV